MRIIIQVRYVYKKPDTVNPSYIQKKLYSIIKSSILDLARVIDTSLVLQKSFQRNRNVHAQPLNHLTNLGDRYFYHPIPFVDVPLITQKRDSWHSVAFSNFSLDTFVPNFFITNSTQSIDIGQNSDKSISDFWISGQALINENYHNSRTSNDIDMKLEPVTKLDK